MGGALRQYRDPPNTAGIALDRSAPSVGNSLVIAGIAKQTRQIFMRPAKSIDRSREFRWLRDHRHEYRGQVLAILGDELIAHGPDYRTVFAEVDRLGVERPIYIRVEEDDIPTIGILEAAP